MSVEFERAHPRGHADNKGSFSDKQHTDPDSSLDPTAELRRDLMTQEPVEVDTALAAIHEELFKAVSRAMTEKQYLDDYVRGNEKREAGNLSYSMYTPEKIEGARAKLEKANKVVADLQDSTIPYEDEFARRGGWTRAFLVDNSGGHVHSSRSCSTCFPTTRFYWLPEYSGGTEQAVVDDAGEGACTVCYPSAPAGESFGNKTKMEAPDRKAARLEREAKAAAKAAKEAVTGIWNPDGTELREASRRWSGQVIKTERAAQIAAVDHLTNALWSASRGDDRDRSGEDWFEEKRETFDRIVTALAHKRGETEDQTLEFLKEKAAAKFRRESR